ncbi:MAG: hypothetical protein FWD17_06545 [Polyangiaceae bacterium]|nr:hypothetical protein [Polyangiaceae bacterium]
MRPKLAAVFAIAGALCIARMAPAQAAPPSTPSAVGEARALEGESALDKGDYEAARLAYAQAYAVDPQPKYLMRLALAESKGGHPFEALGHLRNLEASWSGDAAPEDRRTADALLAEVTAHVGHIRVEAPAGAQITLDDTTPAGVTPLPAPIDVPPGRHTLAARLGAESAATVVTPGPGDTVVWQLQFEPRAPAAPPAPVAPEAAPAPSPHPAAGVDVRRTKKAPPSARWLTSAGLIVGGLASVAVLGGFLAAASDERSKWAVLNLETGYCPQPPSTPQCAALKKAADTRATDQNVAIGFGVAGGALVLAGVAMFLVWPEPHREVPRSSWTPIVGPGVAGAQWTGRF